MRIVFCMLLALWQASTARAMFVTFETEQVPIERVFKSLQAKLSAQPDDFELHYQLGRLHAMAAFKDVETVPVIKDDGRTRQAGQVEFAEPGSDTGTPEARDHRRLKAPGSRPAGKDSASHLREALRHFELSLSALRKSPDLPKRTWLIKPMQLGYAWCLDKAGRRTEAIAAYRLTLAVSWRLEVTKDFKVEDWLKGERMELPLPAEPDHAATGFRARNGYLGAGVCISEECIGYLLDLLDAQKDAEEIRILKLRKAWLGNMGRAVTPLLIPLDDAPFEMLVAPQAQVAFDLDGSGHARRWGWLTPKAAWLVFDARQTGKITSGLQLFGNVTFWVFWRDGYQALGSLDTNGDGVLEGDELKGLALWQDTNGNGVSDPGEVKPLSAYGIDRLSCQGESAGPGLRWSRQGVHFKDGTNRASYDWDVPMNTPEASK